MVQLLTSGKVTKTMEIVKECLHVDPLIQWSTFLDVDTSPFDHFNNYTVIINTKC